MLALAVGENRLLWYARAVTSGASLTDFLYREVGTMQAIGNVFRLSLAAALFVLVGLPVQGRAQTGIAAPGLYQLWTRFGPSATGPRSG